MNQEQAIRITAGGVITLLLVGGIATLVINQNSPENPSSDTEMNNQEQVETKDTDDTAQNNTSSNDEEDSVDSLDEDIDDTSENEADSEEENSETEDANNTEDQEEDDNTSEDKVDSEEENSETGDTNNTEDQEEDDNTSENEGDQDTKTSKIGTGDFRSIDTSSDTDDMNAYQGTIFVKGYATTNSKDNMELQTDSLGGPQIGFYVQKSDNTAFEKYISSNDLGENIMLGCKINNRLNYVNYSDEFGNPNPGGQKYLTNRRRFIKSAEESQYILNSTPENPINLRLTKYENSTLYGSGVPMCLSQFTQISVLDSNEEGLKFEENLQAEAERGDEYSESFSKNDKPFKLKVYTDNEGVTDTDQFQIPTNPEYEYDYSVDWGDSKRDQNVTGDITHTYDEPGTYEISIYGQFPAIQFGRDYQGFEPPFTKTTDGEKVVAITQWGDIQWQSMDKAFLGATSVQSEFWAFTDVPDLSQVKNMSQAFRRMPGFNIDIGDWDVSNVEDMSYMFAGSDHFNVDISEWDTSNVENMAGMFRQARTFDQDISSWCVEQITQKPNKFDASLTSSQWTTQEKPNWGEPCQ